ncbi:type II restriction endonuclease [Pedococcus soli]
MSSLLADRVIGEALESGVAFLKVASRNDLGLTGAHQKGFYIGVNAAAYFTPQPPERGVNHDHPINIEWSDGTVTHSIVKWYGIAKSEYRITSFNRIHNFWAIAPERLGGVLVLIQRDVDVWLGHVLDDSDDIDEVCAALGVTFDDASWSMFLGAEGVQRNRAVPSDCHDIQIRNAAAKAEGFPSTAVMSATARNIVHACAAGEIQPPDDLLVEYLGVEFDLFKAIEARHVLERVQGGFNSVDDFVTEANSVLQRRKSRAGKSLESHLETVLEQHGIAFEAQPRLDGTRPDFVMPSAEAYDAAAPGSEDVFVVAVKTTCKDRWRQIVSEGPKAHIRYLVTLQRGISSAQMREIREAGVRLVVPADRHKDFTEPDRRDLLTIREFIQLLPKRVAHDETAVSLF